ncbi:fungal chitosanase of glycosyl hydrolase group 75-domain-containing protein [Mycena belliarum]|uniref:Endo-chitosanase n=1 Tax=Mycena belliarum TaxID=1033014 RepID=A0AAD6XQE9_9AGAR|nr:fungal chitosanase of glycosyl hydrolase group 75-domain-containing protein [Mycena belliae]
MSSRLLSLYALALASVALAAPLVYHTPRSTSSSSYDEFAADSSLDVSAIYDAAKQATKKQIPGASYLTDPGSNDYVQIYQDWSDLPQVSAFHFIADMDIDCDGVDWNCKGNTGDGQKETSFGALDASKVPWYVIPQSFADKQGNSLKPNALGAIICNGKMFYAIFGDSNGATPQVIGEGSLLLGQACFNTDSLQVSGGNGHDQKDVAYIVFGNEVPTGVGKNTIDLAALKELGDKQVHLLVQDLGLSTKSQ